jgi:predicted MFS family arabinose efflux permease
MTTPGEPPAPIPNAGPRTSRRSIALYMLVVLLYWISLYLYLPTLPSYVQRKSVSLALVGIILSQYGLWQAIIRLPLGIAADWLGQRKPFILAGILLSGLGAWLLGNAQTADGLMVGRAVTGLAAGTWVPLIAAFSGLFPPHEAVRATAILTGVGSVARMLATSATGVLNEAGGDSLAFFLAAGTAGLAALAVLLMCESARPVQPPTSASLRRLLTRRDVLLPSLLAAVSQYAAWAVPFSFLPLHAEQLGAGDVTQSALVSLHIGLVTLGSFAAAAIARRIGARRLVHAGFLLLSAGIGAAALAPALPWVFGAQVCIGMAQGISYPVLMGMSIENVADAERTTATGLHQAVYAVGMFAGPWLSGLLADALGIPTMFGVTALACLAASLLLLRWMP